MPAPNRQQQTRRPPTGESGRVRLSVGDLVKMIDGTRPERLAIWRVHRVVDDEDVTIDLYAGERSLPRTLETERENLRLLTEAEAKEATGSDDDDKDDDDPKRRRWASILHKGLRSIGKIVNAAMTGARTAAAVIEIIGAFGGDPTGGLGGDVMALQATPDSSPLTVDVSKIGSCSKSEIRWLEQYEKALETVMKNAKRRDTTIEDKTRAHKAVAHTIRPFEKDTTLEDKTRAHKAVSHAVRPSEKDAKQHKMSSQEKKPAPRTLAGTNAESERLKSHRQAASDQRHQEPKRPKRHAIDYASESSEDEEPDRRASPTSRHEPDPVSSKRSSETKSGARYRRYETVRAY